MKEWQTPLAGAGGLRGLCTPPPPPAAPACALVIFPPPCAPQALLSSATATAASVSHALQGPPWDAAFNLANKIRSVSTWLQRKYITSNSLPASTHGAAASACSRLPRPPPARRRRLWGRLPAATSSCTGGSLASWRFTTQRSPQPCQPLLQVAVGHRLRWHAGASWGSAPAAASCRLPPAAAQPRSIITAALPAAASGRCPPQPAPARWSRLQGAPSPSQARAHPPPAHLLCVVCVACEL